MFNYYIFSIWCFAVWAPFFGGVESITECNAKTCTACNPYQCKTFTHESSYALSCMQIMTINETIHRCTFCPDLGNCSEILFNDDFMADEISTEDSPEASPESSNRRRHSTMRISRKCGIALCPVDCEGFVLQPPNTENFDGEQCPVCRCRGYGLREPCMNNTDCPMSDDCMLSRGMCRYPEPVGAVMETCRWRWDCAEGQYCHYESFMSMDGHCKTRNRDAYRVD